MGADPVGDVRDGDKRLAAQARAAIDGGGEPTREQQRALKRVEKAEHDALCWQIYTRIPKKHYEQLSGRKRAQIDAQAERYGLPLKGATVDLEAVLRRFHELLAEHRQALGKVAAGEADELMVGGNSAALERYRDAKAKLALLDLRERERELMPEQQVREVLRTFADVLRGAVHQVQKQYGEGPYELIAEAVAEAERRAGELLGADDGPDGE
jgi:hypothetical protein